MAVEKVTLSGTALHGVDAHLLPSHLMAQLPQTVCLGQSDMSPESPIDNARDMCSADSIFHGQLVMGNSACSIGLSDFADDCLGQFGMRKHGSFRVAPLGIHVGLIVGISSEEEMDGIDAGGIVTTMKDVKPSWDRTDHQFVGNTMRSQNCFMWPNLSVHFPIAVNIVSTTPQNAAASRFLANSGKEKVLPRYGMKTSRDGPIENLIFTEDRAKAV